MYDEAVARGDAQRLLLHRARVRIDIYLGHRAVIAASVGSNRTVVRPTLNSP
jgi:hypothetical protein